MDLCVDWLTVDVPYLQISHRSDETDWHSEIYLTIQDVASEEVRIFSAVRKS